MLNHPKEKKNCSSDTLSRRLFNDKWYSGWIFSVWMFSIQNIQPFSLKGTLMQIWKFNFMFVFTSKEYPESFAFLIVRILKLFACEVNVI